MAGKTKYFVDTAYKQMDGNIVYASHLNNPLSAIATAISTMSDDVQMGTSRTGVDTGEVNAYVVSIDPAPTAYTEGLEIWLKTSQSNTGAATINVNSLGVIDIRRHGLDPLLAGDIPANYFTLIKYSGGYFQIVSASGRGEAEASAETATAQAAIATAQAVIATTQAGLAEDAKDEITGILPDIDISETAKFLTVNSSGDAYDLISKEDLGEILKDEINHSMQSGVALRGGISGMDYAKTGSNTILVEAGGCYDVDNSEWIEIPSQTVTIPSVANELYRLFACSDGVIRTDTDADGSNLSSYKIRKIGPVKNNSSGVISEFKQAGNIFSFINFSEAIAMSGITTTESSVDLSLAIPVEMCGLVKLGAHGSSSTTYQVEVSESSGGRVSSIGIISSQTDTTYPWSYGGQGELLPIDLCNLVNTTGGEATLAVQWFTMVR
jgi:hypothetical protein